MASGCRYKNVMELKEACYKRIVEKLDVLSPQQPEDLLTSLREDVKMLMCDHETDYFMSIANLAALRSKDPWTPVGACIVNAEKKVVGIGYNAMPYTPFCDNDDKKQFPWTKVFLDKKLTKYPYVCHAALNAIVNRTIPNLDGCTIYLTLHPDVDCAHLIVQSGIKEVLYDEMLSSKRIEDLKSIEDNLPSARKDKKLKTFVSARDILRLGRVSLRKCKPKIEIELTKREHQQKVDHKYLVTEHFVTESRTLQTDHGFHQTLISGVRCLKKEEYNLLPDETYLVTQDNGSIKKYLLVREDAEERVLTSEAANSVRMSLTLQKRLTSSDECGVINMDLVISWDELFMGLALLEKKFINLNDKKPSSKQGACIVAPSRQILAIGGSGLSPGVNRDAMEETFKKIGGGDPYVCHAEYNAITSYRGVISLKGGTLYVTLSPCYVCAKLIAQAGIVEVVYLNELDNEAYPFEITEKIFEKCNIKFRCMYDRFDVRIDVQGIRYHPTITSGSCWL